MENICTKDLNAAIKGAGETAMDIAHRLYMVRFKNHVTTKIPDPVAVRKTVDFS